MDNHRDREPESDLPVELAQPARMALASAGVEHLAQLIQYSEAEVKRWHGIGPNALSHLRRALNARGLSFANREEQK